MDCQHSQLCQCIDNEFEQSRSFSHTGDIRAALINGKRCRNAHRMSGARSHCTFRACANFALLAQALVTKVFLQYIELMRKVQTTYW